MINSLKTVPWINHDQNSISNWSWEEALDKLVSGQSLWEKVKSPILFLAENWTFDPQSHNSFLDAIILLSRTQIYRCMYSIWCSPKIGFFRQIQNSTFQGLHTICISFTGRSWSSLIFLGQGWLAGLYHHLVLDFARHSQLPSSCCPGLTNVQLGTLCTRALILNWKLGNSWHIGLVQSILGRSVLCSSQSAGERWN